MEQNIPIRVGFIVFSPQMWKSLRPVFDLMVISQDFTPVLIVIKYDVKWGDSILESSNHFWKTLYPDIELYSSDEYLPNLNELDLKFVFKQTPYDFRYPPKYSNHECALNTKLCYIPYNYNFSSEMHLQIEYDDSFLRELSILFSDSKYVSDYCRERVRFANSNLFIYCTGSTAFGRYCDMREMSKSDSRFSFLWIPRWSVDHKYNHGTSFFNYFNRLIDFFSSNSNCELMIRPHPFMFEQFVERGILSKKDVEKILYDISKTENINFDITMDYYESFLKSDALIADYSSLIVEYYLTCKPIILCDDNCDWNTEPLVEDVSRSLYCGFDWESLRKRMLLLSEGDDEQKELRKLTVKKHLKHHKDAANIVLEVLRNKNE